VGPALFVLGLVVSLVGCVMVVSLAFRKSVLWGLGTIFVPFVYLIFAITHWDDAKKGFLTGVSGAAIVMLSILFTPAPRKHVPEPVQEQASVVATTTHATFESINTPPPQPVPPPVTQEEPAQPVFAQVWADNRARLYYPKECAQHPDNAYLLARSVAISQGYKAAQCK
jgi:hypothetical protein